MVFELFHELVVTINLQNVVQLSNPQAAQGPLGNFMNSHFLLMTFRRLGIEALEKLTEANDVYQFVSNHIHTKGKKSYPFISFHCRYYILVL